ncbi:MAG: LytTR family DNA-binding domain-containing protein [Cyclobacteriaceae bacterium]
MSGTLFKAKRYLSSHYDMTLVGLIVPVISVLMWYLGRISPEYQTSFTLGTFLINTLYTSLIVIAVKVIVSSLWRKLMISSKPKKAMIVLATALVAYLLIHTLILSFIEQKSEPTLLIVLYAIGASLVIAMVFLFISKEISHEQISKTTFLKVTCQGRSTKLKASDVNIVEMKNQLAVLTDTSGIIYLSTQPLRTIERALGTDRFYRINRQQIIKSTAVEKWERQPNKTFKVWLTGKDRPMIVSRSRATAWKAWMSTTTDVQR